MGWSKHASTRWEGMTPNSIHHITTITNKTTQTNITSFPCDSPAHINHIHFIITSYNIFTHIQHKIKRKKNSNTSNTPSEIPSLNISDLEK
jgi:hypothetical protein